MIFIIYYSFGRQPINNKEQFLLLADKFLKSESGRYNEYELEVKFGTRGVKYITKMDYENVVKQLKTSGFTCANETGDYKLNIQPEFLDMKTGEFRMTNNFDRFRVELSGFHNIQEYCGTNDILKIKEKSPYSITLMRKSDVKEEGTDQFIRSADFDEFNFRVTYKNEEKISHTSKLGADVYENWQKSKKIFRYMNRVTFVHSDYPFKVDMSIVRTSSKGERGQLEKTYNVSESGVFENQEIFEIEIEVINNKK